MELQERLAAVLDDILPIQREDDGALTVHPEYPDAHFQKAETLAELGQIAEAAPYWPRYLTYDRRGPWADLARQRLSELR